MNLTYGSATIAGYFIGTLPLTILMVLNPQEYGASNLLDLFGDVAGIPILAGLLGAAAGATFRGIVGYDHGSLASE